MEIKVTSPPPPHQAQHVNGGFEKYSKSYSIEKKRERNLYCAPTLQLCTGPRAYASQGVPHKGGSSYNV